MSRLILPAGVRPATNSRHPSELAAASFMRHIPLAFHKSLFAQLAEANERLDAMSNSPGAEEDADEREGMRMLTEAYSKFASGQELAGVELLQLAWFVRDCADFSAAAAADAEGAEQDEPVTKH